MKTIVKIILILLLAVGCQKDPTLNVIVGEKGEKVDVELHIRLQQHIIAGDDEKTKSVNEGFHVEFDSTSNPIHTRANDNTTLYNLYIFQFKADGTLAQPTILIDEVAPSMTDNIIELPVTLTVGQNQTLYLVALGKALTNNLMEVSSLSALKRYPFTYVDAVNGVYLSKIKNELDVPFAGKAEKVNIIASESGNTGLIQYDPSQEFSGGISLHRLVSKVSLNYSFDVKDYRVFGVRLKSVPSQFTIEPSASDNISYVDMEIQKPINDNTTMYNTMSWYIAPNKQGTVESIIVESERYRRFNEDYGTPLTGNAPNQATYFDVWTKQNNSVDYVVYQIYIGKNNTSDFNIESNHYYTINTHINADISSIINDNRIRIFSVNHFVQLYCSRVIRSSTSEGPYLADRDIDAHYDTRPIVVNTDGRIVTVGIYTDQACTTLAADDAWLQVSPHANYTLAYNSNSLSNTAIVRVDVPSKVVLYLYNDEFIPENLSSTSRRDLFVKVVTSTLNLPTEIESTDIFRMGQYPPINLGLFGGTLGETGYQSNLVMDFIDEGANNYVAVLPPPLTIKSSYLFGYDGINTSAYGTDDAIHGAAATRALAENKNDYIIDATNAIPQTNGDLYQYNYYNSFPARFCYDMNRDLNGNGIIDDNELKWYLPTINQIMGFWLSDEYAPLNINTAKWSTNRLSLVGGYVLADNRSPIRCVRDIK